MKMSVRYCVGCENDFYNGKNPLGVEECWSRENAKSEKRLLIPIDLRPPYVHIKPQTLPTCYHRARYVTVKPESIGKDGYWRYL